MASTRRHLVIDGNNMLLRAVHAGQHQPMEVDGIATGPLLIFINLVSRYIREVEPDHVVVCWDGGKSTHRVAIFDGYKSARLDKPNDEKGPFAQAKEFLTLANIHHVEQHGVEADDLVASYWHGKGNDDRIYILSGDKDFLQLLDGWTEQIRPGVNPERWTANVVRTRMQCKPEHIPFVMALTGDSGDNVPGIPGFGHKTACKALAAFDWDLEQLLASCDPKWGKKLFGHVLDVRRNLALVDLRSPIEGIHVPLAPRFDPTVPSGVLYDGLIEFLSRYKMESVKSRLQMNTLWKD